MNKLEELVGLSPVDTGSDRMYVNRIPNVNPDLIVSIAEDDEKSADDPTGLATIWQEVKDEAYDKLRSDLLSEMSKRSTFREVVEASQLPDLISDSETLSAVDDMMVGVVITMPKSRYQTLFVRSLYMLFGSQSAPESITIRIYDIDRGRQIGADIAVPVNADGFDYPLYISIPCDKVGARSIFVGVLVPAGTELISFGWDKGCMYAANEFYQFNPNDAPVIGNMSEVNDCFVALEYEIRLGVDLLFNHFGDRLRRTYALMCAIGVIERGLKSKKATRWTLVNRDAEKQNIIDLKEDLKKELSGACRQIYGQVEQERLTLISKPDDHAGYYLGSYV